MFRSSPLGSTARINVKRVAAFFALLASLGAPALAQQAPPAAYVCLINSAAATTSRSLTPILGFPLVFNAALTGVVNNSLVAQTVTVLPGSCPLRPRQVRARKRAAL
jgi:hypothetical protein